MMGAALYATGITTVKLNKALISANTSKVNGSVSIMEGNDKSLTINDFDITGNLGAQAVRAYNVQAAVTNSRLSKNASTALYLSGEGTTGVISDCVITENGGTNIDIRDGEYTVKNVSITDRTGTAIYTDAAKMELTDCVMINTGTINMTGLIFANHSDVTVAGCEVAGCYVSYGISAQSGTALTVKKSEQKETLIRNNSMLNQSDNVP